MLERVMRWELSVVLQVGRLLDAASLVRKYRMAEVWRAVDMCLRTF
jgi:hypothetical protein